MSKRQPQGFLGVGSLSSGTLRSRSKSRKRPNSIIAWIVIVNLSLAATAALVIISTSTSIPLSYQDPTQLPPFYADVRSVKGLCQGEDGKGVSHAGFIGLEGDSEETPKRSFFWYFEAQKDPEDAPTILTIGGGPGTSGMSNPLAAQSHCLVGANGTTSPNPNAWTERFNLLALDHPVGAGYSYGTMVNSSRASAVDAYDFLQKFFNLYPQLARNKFIISGGSYGGMYVPHIATVIHEENRARARGEGRPGAVHINLESLMISNPFSDAMSHFQWWLHQACYNTNLYNSTTCTDMYALLPACLESIQYAYENPTVANKVVVYDMCALLQGGDTHGTMTENVSKKCNGTFEDCFPYFTWLSTFMNSPQTKDQLGIPSHLEFQPVNRAVTSAFKSTGDHVQQAYLLYEPLLQDGIRLLHYIGALDANCAWPGVFSFLKLLQSPYQQRFIDAPDIPWPSNPPGNSKATVRAVGKGTGDMTYILIKDAGHFVAGDQPALVKTIVERWIDNEPFL